MESKSIKLGILMTNKNGNKTIKLGSEQEGDKAKFNYTVEIRVKDSNGNVVHMAKNPWVNLSKPRTVDKEGNPITTKVEYELQVFKDNV